MKNCIVKIIDNIFFRRRTISFNVRRQFFVLLVKDAMATEIAQAGSGLNSALQ